MASNNQSTNNIAIIGGGASGTNVAIQLLKNLHFKANIFLFETDQEKLFRGAAYSSKLPYEPLNVPAGRMSIFPDEPDDFYNWVVEHRDKGITKDSFVSRRWFGDYLSHQFNLAEARKHKDVVINIVRTGVDDIRFDPLTNRYSVITTDGLVQETDSVVLATGNEQPADINNSLKHLPGYISNPWKRNILDILEEGEDVLLIGSGLTMVDIAASIYKSRENGKVYCISRHAYLPNTHIASPNAQPLAISGNESVKELFLYLRNEIRKQTEEGIHWSKIIDALRPYTVSLWQNFDKQEKKFFLSRLKQYWEVHRHRMPQQSTDILMEMKDANRLALISGTVLSAADTPQGIEVIYNSKGDKIKVQHIINCTGPFADIARTNNQLLQNLYKKGWLGADELGLGVKTGKSGEIITQSGEILHKIYAIGPLRKATEWESTAMREIVAQANSLAVEIISEHPDIDELLSNLKNLAPGNQNTLYIRNIISRIKPEAFNYNSFLPASADKEYKRVTLLKEPLECTIIYWPPGSSSAIHNHEGYEGLVVVLDGNIQESEYVFTDNILKEKKSDFYTKGSILREKLNTIHRISNNNTLKPAVSLHIYTPAPKNFGGTEIYDEIKLKKAVLSDKAHIISWNIQEDGFRQVEENAFSFEPLLEFMI
jgi:uncharacterized NAD(P)/FAD-binding protein YdhS/predicted metal-dependent enzyme (double-stranded beta helix superfamily)